MTKAAVEHTLRMLTFTGFLIFAVILILWLAASALWFVLAVCFSPVFLSESLKLPKTDTYGG